jgi:hypothetical protein
VLVPTPDTCPVADTVPEQEIVGWLHVTAP